MFPLASTRNASGSYLRCQALVLRSSARRSPRPIPQQCRVQSSQCLRRSFSTSRATWESSSRVPHFLSWGRRREEEKKPRSFRHRLVGGTLWLTGGAAFLFYILGDDILHTQSLETRENAVIRRQKRLRLDADDNATDGSSWGVFSRRFKAFALFTDTNSSTVAKSISEMVVPEWVRPLAGYVQKLQRELNMAPDSLAAEIKKEAQDPELNPEILYPAYVRVSEQLCDDEKLFLLKRRQRVKSALAQYLDIPEDEIHPDDIPTIAMVGSGGGLRALVAGTGSLLATKEAGLFDCVTYTAGVSGSCWLQALFHSSFTGQRLDKMVDHMKARLGVHIAYPPVALSSLISAPTNKFLLRGFVEKLLGDPDAHYGLVDLYGVLLAARLLVPRGDLGVKDSDLKLSFQRENLRHGENPLPIYTAVRHEIPIDEESTLLEKATNSPSEETKERAKREAWFQWFEITPYEFFCEEFSAGIPTWAMGRRFENGKDNTPATIRVPEIRLSLLLGIFGSAFCASLSHYYKEVRPILRSFTGFGSVDEVIEGRSEDLSKVHPIEAAAIPNFAYGMYGKLPPTTPRSIYENTHIRLMDAGMSNNLPIYPLLRPGRNVDILIAFDASADVKQDDWLSVADGYARQRGIKGWPVGIGWPKGEDPPSQTAVELEEAQAASVEDAEAKIEQAKHYGVKQSPKQVFKDLGYCNVWVGTTEERSYDEQNEGRPPSKALAEDWELTSPNAGIAIVYFPQLANPKVSGIDPMQSDFMSTWNFVYTPEQIDKVVELSRANFDEGRERTRRVVRAVYERKKKLREEKEQKRKAEKRRRKIRLGIVDNIGQGDHFS